MTTGSLRVLSLRSLIDSCDQVFVLASLHALPAISLPSVSGEVVVIGEIFR